MQKSTLHNLVYLFQACLSCPSVACGRYIAEHALKHYQDTKVMLLWTCTEIVRKVFFVAFF